MPKTKDTVNIEKIGSKRYYVARSSTGRFLGRKPVKGSNLTLSNARELYRQGGTFKQDLIREIYTTSTGNYNEVSLLSSTYKDTKGKTFRDRVYATGDKPRNDKVMYVCVGTYKGETIAARSNPRFKQNKRQMIAETREDFLGKLGQASLRNKANSREAPYDADEGNSVIEDVKDYREGWVYYSRN